MSPKTTMTSPSVTYSSTRGGQKNLSFREVVMQGLAHDRGLFVPDFFPQVSTEELESWRGLSYADLAVNVIGKFVHEDQVPRAKLEDIVKRSCAAFRSEEVTPIVYHGGLSILVRRRVYISLGLIGYEWIRLSWMDKTMNAEIRVSVTQSCCKCSH